MSRRGGSASRQAEGEHTDSLLEVYWRRFKKHRLGRIGGIVLIVLYALALLADPLAPATMLWTDKTKSYQPPTGIRFSYLDGGRLVVRPFVYEMHIVNQALRTYGRVPRHTLRVVSEERAAGRAELRSLALQEDAAARSRASLDAVQRHFRLADTDPRLGELQALIGEVEAAPARDLHRRVRLHQAGASPETLELIVAKGNKNFVGLFARGVPYRFLGLFTARTHLLASPTGGFFPLGTDHAGARPGLAPAARRARVADRGPGRRRHHLRVGAADRRRRGLLRRRRRQPADALYRGAAVVPVALPAAGAARHLPAHPEQCAGVLPDHPDRIVRDLGGRWRASCAAWCCRCVRRTTC